MSGMGGVKDNPESARSKVARYVLGLSLIVLLIPLGVVLEQQSAGAWWLAVSIVLVPVGVELSVAPEIRAWNQRNRARIAERDATLRTGFERPDQ